MRNGKAARARLQSGALRETNGQCGVCVAGLQQPNVLAQRAKPATAEYRSYNVRVRGRTCCVRKPLRCRRPQPRDAPGRLPAGLCDTVRRGARPQVVDTVVCKRLRLLVTTLRFQ